MLQGRRIWLGLGVSAALAALVVTACEGKHIGGEDTDYEASAQEVCAWQRECLAEFDREFDSVAHCVELELYRHAAPDACVRSNEAFKRCMTTMTCEEFAEVRADFDALTQQSDAGIPDSMPCLFDLLLYNEQCAEWSCDNGQIINRQDVCDREDDCADHTDEVGCP